MCSKKDDITATLQLYDDELAGDQNVYEQVTKYVFLMLKSSGSFVNNEFLEYTVMCLEKNSAVMLTVKESCRSTL